MPRILLAECKQEVSTFNPGRSAHEDFRIVRRQALLDHHRRVREEVGGALSVFDKAPGVELVPALGASANTSGGVLSRAGFERLAGEFLADIAAAGPVDAAFFSLHGAMEAEGELDPEGYLLQEARKILGATIPFVVTLDLHGILTDRMLQHTDVTVAYHTYPHVDFFETGARGARALLRVLKQGLKPVTARVKIPALVRGNELITETGSIRHCVNRARQIEALPNALSAAVMWGNPFTDVPELRTNSFVVLERQPEEAQRMALELAGLFWQHHETMQVPLTSLADSIRQAAGVTSGTVILKDAADATSSGASGDSNAIVREIIRQGYPGRVLAPIVDAPAVRAAFSAGVGATIQTTVGGTVDPGRFEPLPVTARVKMLSDGQFRSESCGWPGFSGDTAVQEVGPLTLRVGSRPVSLTKRTPSTRTRRAGWSAWRVRRPPSGWSSSTSWRERCAAT
ncbi:MAG: M81 family metallopeptidase [Planctomycetaceae bacterium]